MMFVPCHKECYKWTDHTLIVPAVSVGNVGQLTADLLISTLCMAKVGYIYSDAVLPLIGNDPFATTEHTSTQSCKLVTAVEVYQSVEHKLIVVQQRAPLVKGRKPAFIQELMTWIEETGFEKVIVLTSSFAHERLDSQLQGSQLRYVLSPKMAASCEGMLRDTLSWTALEKKTSAVVPVTDPDGLFVAGGGIALDLLRQCTSAGLQAAVLLLFCAEGDNVSDAIELATHLNSWLGLLDLKKAASLSKHTKHGWRIPTSWQKLYGNDFTQTLYY